MINNARERMDKKKLNYIKQNHQEQKDQLENEFQKELNECNEFWEKKIEDYNESSNNLQSELAEKHQARLEKYEETLNESMPDEGRMTPEVLNLEFQIRMLVRDQRYKEADALQKKTGALRDRVMKKNVGQIQSTKNHKMDHFVQKQEFEMQALMCKVDTGRDELIKAREKDYQKLVSKYRVLREKLDEDQIKDFHRKEKDMKNFKPSSNILHRSMQGESRFG